MNSMFHLPVWLVNAICALRFCLYFSASSLSGLPGPKAEPILKYQGGNRTQREKYAPLIRSVPHPWGKCDPASVPFIPRKALQVIRNVLAANPRGASQSLSCFFEGSGLWPFLPVSHSLALVPRTKSRPDMCSLFSQKLLGAARHFSSHLPFPHLPSPGRQVKPTALYPVSALSRLLTPVFRLLPPFRGLYP